MGQGGRAYIPTLHIKVCSQLLSGTEHHTPAPLPPHGWSVENSSTRSYRADWAASAETMSGARSPGGGRGQVGGKKYFKHFL